MVNYIATRPPIGITPETEKLMSPASQSQQPTLSTSKFLDQVNAIQKNRDNLRSVMEKFSAYKNAIKEAKEKDNSILGGFPDHPTTTGSNFADNILEKSYNAFAPEEVQKAYKAFKASYENEFIPAQLRQDNIQPTVESLKHAYEAYDIKNLGMDGVEAAIKRAIDGNKLNNYHLAQVLQRPDPANLYQDQNEFLREGNELEHSFTVGVADLANDRKLKKSQALENEQAEKIKNAPINKPMETREDMREVSEEINDHIDDSFDEGRNENGEISKTKAAETAIKKITGKPIADLTHHDIFNLLTMLSYARMGKSRALATDAVVSGVAASMNAFGPAGAALGDGFQFLYSLSSGLSEGIQAYEEYHGNSENGIVSMSDLKKVLARGLIRAAPGMAGMLLGKITKSRFGGPAGPAKKDTDLVNPDANPNESFDQFAQDLDKQIDSRLGERDIGHGGLTHGEITDALDETRIDDDITQEFRNAFTGEQGLNTTNKTRLTPSQTFYRSMQKLRSPKSVKRIAEGQKTDERTIRDSIDAAQNYVLPKAKDLLLKKKFISRLRQDQKIDIPTAIDQIKSAGFNAAEKRLILPKLARRLYTKEEFDDIMNAASKDSDLKLSDVSFSKIVWRVIKGKPKIKLPHGFERDVESLRSKLNIR